jgi:hypothetical protein
MTPSILASERTILGIVASLSGGLGRESANTHLVFSAVCARGDVVIASAQITSRAFSTILSCSYQSLIGETTTVLRPMEARL